MTKKIVAKIYRHITVKSLVKKLKTNQEAKDTLKDLKEHFATAKYALNYEHYLIGSGLNSCELNLLIEKLGCGIVYEQFSTRLLIVKL